MRTYNKSALKFLLAAAFSFATPLSVLADCSSDIDKVEAAIVKASEYGIDVTTAEKMRELLDDANAEKNKGDEAKCQELIDQAKYIGNVD